MHRPLKYIAIIFLITLAGGIWFFVNQIKVGKEADETKNFHAAMYYYDNNDFFLQAVKTFKDVKPLTPAPHIFIVNQHVLAAHIIAQQFALSADNNVKTVVLITQNNWVAGSAPIITSRYGWRTSLGNILPETALADLLINKNIASDEEDIFLYEHGITGIMPFVAHSFPNAKVVPLVIRDNAPNSKIDELAEQLSKLDMLQTVIVGSIDMSHYLPKYLADAHDRITVRAIKQFDYAILPRLDIDTAPTLRTILKVAETTGQRSFVQTAGTNSADIVGDPGLIETTSYISGYFKPGNTEKIDGTINILFVGNIFFNTEVENQQLQSGTENMFSRVNRLFLGTDIVVGSLEGLIINDKRDYKDKLGSAHILGSETADVLGRLYFTSISLANNHVWDYGQDGYEETVRNLNHNNIQTFGSPKNNKDLSLKISKQDKTICLIAYNSEVGVKQSRIVEEINNNKKTCFYQIVFVNQDNQFSKISSESQKKFAHEFVDVGADLVIGTNSQTIQSAEIYKNKAIFYSLGSFVDDRKSLGENGYGLVLNTELSKDKVQFSLIPIKTSDSVIEIVGSFDREKAINLIVGNGLPRDVESDIIKSYQFTLWNNILTKQQ